MRLNNSFLDISEIAERNRRKHSPLALGNSAPLVPLFDKLPTVMPLQITVPLKDDLQLLNGGGVAEELYELGHLIEEYEYISRTVRVRGVQLDDDLTCFTWNVR